MMTRELLISQFIDDELDMNGKKKMVRHILDDAAFADETLELLELEGKLRHPFPEKIPLRPHPARSRIYRWAPVLRIAAAVIAVVAISAFWANRGITPPPVSQNQCPVTQRFVIYLPNAETVEIAGTFTRWDRVPLRRLGSSGYWEINMDLIPGEHRFSYIVGGDRSIADPTIATREKDDFGGINSVIIAGDRA